MNDNHEVEINLTDPDERATFVDLVYRAVHRRVSNWRTATLIADAIINDEQPEDEAQ